MKEHHKSSLNVTKIFREFCSHNAFIQDILLVEDKDYEGHGGLVVNLLASHLWGLGGGLISTFTFCVEFNCYNA